MGRHWSALNAQFCRSFPLRLLRIRKKSLLASSPVKHRPGSLCSRTAVGETAEAATGFIPRSDVHCFSLHPIYLMCQHLVCLGLWMSCPPVGCIGKGISVSKNLLNDFQGILLVSVPFNLCFSGVWPTSVLSAWRCCGEYWAVSQGELDITLLYKICSAFQNLLGLILSVYFSA